MSYTHHISLNGSDYVQVYPTNKVEITTEQEPECIFFRDIVNDIKINKELNSSMYDSLETYFTDKTTFNDQLEYEIYAGPRAGDPFYKALFSISDCTIDLEKKFINIPMRTNDEYREILENWENIYGVSTPYKIAVPTNQSITWVAGSPNSTIADFDTFTEGASSNIITSLINSSGIPSDPECRHFSLGNITDVSPPAIVTVYVKEYTKNSGSDLEIRVWNDSDVDITDEGSVTINDEGYFSISIDTTASPANFLLYAPDLFNGSITLEVWFSNSDYVGIGAGMKFIDMIEDYLTDTGIGGMGLTIGVESTFFNNDALPSDAPSSISTWIGSNPNGNYVIESTTNRLNNFCSGNGERWDDAINTQYLTLKTWLNAIKDFMQVYWYIDADGDFRLEHKMYFEKLWEDSTPIVVSTYSAYNPEVDRQLIEYNKSLIYAREEFSQAQTTSDQDFIGLPIIYDIFETIGQTLKYSQSITADVMYMLSDDGNKSGIVFYDCVPYGSLVFVVTYATGALSSVYKSNGYLSWANLHSNYWSWGRMSENANINGSDVTVDSVEPFLEQDGVKFPYATAIPWYNEITSSVGAGKILTMSRELDSDFITFKLSYNPYE